MMILPRFKLEYEVKTQRHTQSTGDGHRFRMVELISPAWGRVCSLAKFDTKPSWRSTKRGQKPAAVTVVVGVESAPPSFIVDRPFFFAIHDEKTKTILFMGIVVEPM